MHFSSAHVYSVQELTSAFQQDILSMRTGRTMQVAMKPVGTLVRTVEKVSV